MDTPNTHPTTPVVVVNLGSISNSSCRQMSNVGNPAANMAQKIPTTPNSKKAPVKITLETKTEKTRPTNPTSLRKIVPKIVSLQKQEASSELKDGVRIKVIRPMQYKKSADMQACFHCPGLVFSSEKLAEHIQEMHLPKLRCTHCDFSCGQRNYKTMSDHYFQEHKLYKHGMDLFEKHQIPVSIPKGNDTTLDFSAITGLKNLPTFAVEKSTKCTKNLVGKSGKLEDSDVELGLQSEDVKEENYSWYSEEPSNLGETSYPDWSPIFLSQESLVPLPSQFSSLLGKPAFMEKTQQGNFVLPNPSNGEPVSEYIKILENQFGDHHIFQYLTRAERVKKLEHLIKNSGLLMSGNSLADLLETLLSDLIPNENAELEKNEPSISDYNKVKVFHATDDCVMLERYGCVRCPFEALTPEAVKNHWVKYHVPYLPYQCVHCRIVVSDTKTLVNHIIQMHPGSRVAYWIKTTEDLFFQLQVETERFAPMMSDEDFRQAEYQCLGIYVHKAAHKHSLLMVRAMGYSVFSKWYCCHLCTYRTIHIGALVRHNKICILPNVQTGGPINMCKFCKNLYRFSRLDLVSHQADSACTPHVKKSKQIAVEVDRMITRKYKEIEKLTKFFSSYESVSSPLVLDWHNIMDVCFIGDAVFYVCKVCSHQPSSSIASILDHVSAVHKWPASFCCGCQTAAVVSDKDRENKILKCGSCNMMYDLKQVIQALEMSKTTDKPETEEPRRIILRCKACNYTTTDKQNASRHSSKHVKILMYKCTKCGFVDPRSAVVKDHIANLHENCTTLFLNERVINSDNHTELIEEVDQRIEGMKSSGSSISYIPKWKMWLDFIDKRRATKTKKCKGVAQSVKNSKASTTDKELEEQLYQYHTEIMYGRTAKELAKNMEKVFNEVHYQCLACLYRCTDRSCMTRHVKYMHLQRFAHCCPYCNYGSVEKTKVKHHVQHYHRNSPAVSTDTKVLYEMKEDVKDYFVKVDPENQKLIAPQRRKTKLKNSNVKHVKMGGPRAKSLEYLLRNRKENKLTKVGISGQSLGLESLDVSRLSEKSFEELQNMTMLTLEAEKQMAWVNTPTGILRVDFHGYTPKIEMLDTKPVLTEGVDFEAIEVKWDQESEGESDNYMNVGNQRGIKVLDIKQEKDQSSCTSNFEYPGDTSSSNEHLPHTVVYNADYSTNGILPNNTEQQEFNRDSNTRIVDALNYESTLCRSTSTKPESEFSTVPITCMSPDKTSGEYRGLPVDDNPEILHMKLSSEDIKEEDESPYVVKPIMVVETESLLLGSAEGSFANLHQVQGPQNNRDGNFTKTLGTVRPGFEDSNAALTRNIPNRKRHFRVDSSYEPQIKLKKSDTKQFLVENNINHPSVHSLILDYPLLSVRTSVELTDIMKHLLNFV